jgi:hypothetical protein
MTAITPAPAPQSSWMPTRKWIAWAIANVLGWAVAFAITKLGINVSASAAVQVSSVVGFISGAAAAYIVKEIPRLEQDVKPAATKM